MATDPLKAVLEEAQAPFGILFLDRTRIRPLGAVIGEPLLSLSLAPGEAVVIEQKAFSQRTTTFEDVNETTSEQSLELDSTLTTAMELALNQQRNQSTKTDAGAQAGFNGASAGVPVSVSAQASQSLAQADTVSRNSSLKSTSVASRKVTSKYKSLHKTTLTVSTQTQFTSSSQRTIHNPNRFTPVDLRYFKVYQELELSHERYGVRLAWSPTIVNPGEGILRAADAAYSNAIDTALAALPLPPPPADPGQYTGRIEVTSQIVTINGKFGGGNDWTQTVTVAAPPVVGTHAWAWDGDAPFVIGSVLTIPNNLANFTWEVHGQPWLDASGAVNVAVHVSWSNSNGSVDVQVTARFVQGELLMAGQPDPQQTYAQLLIAYNAEVASMKVQAALNAEPNARAARDNVIAESDTISECLSRLMVDQVASKFLADPNWLETWRSLFDWNLVSVTLYPGWFSSPRNDPTRPAEHLVNALAARLYVPVRPGQEAAAAELVIDVLTEQGNPPLVDTNALAADISTFRTLYLGGPDEIATIGPAPGTDCPLLDDRHICLGRWTELLPTEGTHLEVLQAATIATDDLNEALMASQASLLAAQTAAVQGRADVDEAVSKHVDGSTTSVSVVVRDPNVPASPAASQSLP